MALFHVDFFSDTLGMCEMADVIIPQGGHNQVALEMVIERVRAHLSK